MGEMGGRLGGGRKKLIMLLASAVSPAGVVYCPLLDRPIPVPAGPSAPVSLLVPLLALFLCFPAVGTL